MSGNILVIDDEKDIRQLVAVILESAGYAVSQASNGQHGLSLLQEAKYDLIITDVMMPGVDGWEVCRQVKAMPHSRQSAVIFLTVRNQPLDRIMGMEVTQADGYLTKPFDQQELLEIVAETLSTRKNLADDYNQSE